MEVMGEYVEEKSVKTNSYAMEMLRAVEKRNIPKLQYLHDWFFFDLVEEKVEPLDDEDIERLKSAHTGLSRRITTAPRTLNQINELIDDLDGE